MHFTSQKAVCKYNGGGKASMNTEIGLKTAIGTQNTNYDTQTGKTSRTERENERMRRIPDRIDGEVVIAMSWMPDCPRTPKGEGKTTPTAPTPLTKDCITCSTLPLPRQIPLTDSYSGVNKRILLVGQARGKQNILTSTNLDWHPLWSSEKKKQQQSSTGREVPQCLSSKQHHITSFWVMSPGLFPLLLPCFFPFYCWFNAQSQKNITSLFRDFFVDWRQFKTQHFCLLK